MSGSVLRLIVIALLTVLLPLAGAVLSGQPLSSLLIFPLNTRGWDPAPINAAFTHAAQLFAILCIGTLLWLCWPRQRKRPDIADGQRRTAQHPWPRFVWISLLLLLVALIAIDGKAFNVAIGLLTLALTLLLNADTERRTGSSLISQRRGYFLLLFPASLAAGWLVFYWLNLFIGVWTYPNATEAVPFALGKSLDYASLLPALLSLRQWLGSFPRLLRWTQSGLPIGDLIQEGWPMMGLAGLALASAAVWPDQLYPLMLIAPTFLTLGLQIALRQATSLSGIAQGDWSRPMLTAAAATLLIAFGQALNLLLGALTSASPAWTYQLPLLGGVEFLGLPAPAWLIALPLALLGLWLADQLTEPFKSRPQTPRFQPGAPIQIPITDLLRQQKKP
ncbi:hypothetical protein [Halochromatium roseum]|uniref:hypothetical protein n=1 Tax=Halochromatium roseum TaxID=391920 RepID=UPI0019138F30|nr:hypothetical protein [Halochromatium roseum]MBK5939902.1 hypothetical protein [Halochromatium roseum]